ncbi:hypothetical protein [Rhizobium binae]|uniref:hypothetical protein n=1 Tax=Rhizobium binae TaxID=1138190 RepID=UPI001C83A315|nr:hypothetical protein [Rhizobium binae]MBX4937433.1 hypothetical protein [Rhizobium binae]MBX4944271.1 hypothetical protein [Rhizobium binae]MBX4962196.1 hypothetical protein [Rhizobium binae]MBX4979502.1 hypothetical protein [Rhizobium binae]
MPVEGCHKLVSPFRVSVSEHDSQILCSAAIQLFNDGKTNVDDLVAGLIEMFPAPRSAQEQRSHGTRRLAVFLL